MQLNWVKKIVLLIIVVKVNQVPYPSIQSSNYQGINIQNICQI